MPENEIKSTSQEKQKVPAVDINMPASSDCEFIKAYGDWIRVSKARTIVCSESRSY